MVENPSELADAKATLAAAKARVNALRPWYKKKRFIIPLAILLIWLLASSSRPEPSRAPNQTESGAVTEQSQIEEFPNETVNQKNARLSAQSYLDYSSFSRKGLIQQLEYEGFNLADAEYGVDVLEVDWKEQAALEAASYLRYSPFSRQGLLEQLLYEGFSEDEAEFGVATTGLN